VSALNALPSGGEDEAVMVVVEIPTGSRNKYEMDQRTGQIVLDRMLFTAVRYPADYGFIADTLAEDGDPLDALVLVGEPTFPGCRIRARPVGLFKMWDEKGPDEKIICVPLRDPMWSHVAELDDLPAALRAEIEHFFAIYKDLEAKKTGTEGFDGRGSAARVIAEARERLRQEAETGRVAP
jgi:inorganic pyrophosphatase